MLHSIDNWSKVSFILPTINLTFPLLLVLFLGLCKTPKKSTRKKSKKLSSISRVTLILVSSIFEVQIHWSASPTLTGLAKMIIGGTLMIMCFTLELDRWFIHVGNIRYKSPCRLQKWNIMASFMQEQS
jgi:hypothetical protein